MAAERGTRSGFEQPALCLSSATFKLCSMTLVKLYMWSSLGRGETIQIFLTGLSWESRHSALVEVFTNSKIPCGCFYSKIDFAAMNKSMVINMAIQINWSVWFALTMWKKALDKVLGHRSLKSSWEDKTYTAYQELHSWIHEKAEKIWG